MKILKKVATAYRNRKKSNYADLSSWKLSLIGIPTFLLGSFVTWQAQHWGRELFDVVTGYKLGLDACIAFGLIGTLALSGLYLLDVSRRCHDLIRERLFV
ncbi:hypothetical protein [Pseudomonas sp. REB1044]|uniref:hypothetical protein n=1 Tax=Pseudomonas sp. REB1044 TaxID=2675224 RepID=UPI00315D4249